MRINWGKVIDIIGRVVKPKEVIPARCPIDGMPLFPFDDSGNKRCANGHVFGPTAPRVNTTTPENTGDHHGEI